MLEVDVDVGRFAAPQRLWIGFLPGHPRRPADSRVPTYVAFEFGNGLTLSLWSTSVRNFVSGGSGHRSEIAFLVPDDKAVRDLHERWREAGVVIEQALHEAVFGLTFVASDPDGRPARSPHSSRTKLNRPRVGRAQAGRQILNEPFQRSLNDCLGGGQISEPNRILRIVKALGEIDFTTSDRNSLRALYVTVRLARTCP